MKRTPTAIRVIGVMGNVRKGDVLAVCRKILAWCKRRSIRAIVEKDLLERLRLSDKAARAYRGNVKQSDLILTLGGDGFLFSAARHLYPCSVPLLHVNLGSLGYNAQATADEMFRLLDEMRQHPPECQERLILQGELWRGRKRLQRFYALNDIVVQKSTESRIIHLVLSIDGQLVNQYRADGLIVSTPTGSTAYNLAAGGPVLHPGVEAIVIAALCPHSISNRAVLVPPTSLMEIQFRKHKDREDAVVSVDCQEWHALKPDDRVRICRAPQKMRLVVNPNWSYFRVLHEKLGWGEPLDV